MTGYHSYDPVTGHGLPHDPLKAIVGPRPIGWISTVDAAGRANLAPYSYFNLFSQRPPLLIFGSEGRKHTLANVEATGEFVFNLVTRPFAAAMNETSADHPADTDEFDAAGLAKLPSETVRPPRVAGVAAAMECRVTEIRPLADLSGEPVASRLVIGQVLRVHVDRACLVDGLFDITRAATIARCGYRGDYVETSHVFEMPRPR